MAISVAAALVPALATAAPSVEFDSSLLQGTMAGKMDLNRYEQGSDQPGIYSAEITVNGSLVATREIELRATASGAVSVCLPDGFFDLLGLDMSRLTSTGELQGSTRAGVATDPSTAPVAHPFPQGITCEAINQYIPDATAVFDAGEQILAVSVPQFYLLRNPRGWVDPKLWDSGIDAGLLSYSATHQRISNADRDHALTGAFINAGLNIAGWRLRHSGYYQHASGKPGRYNVGRTYLQRALPSLGMELTAGEASTNGDLFDSVGYRGISLRTDPRMLPDSQRDYAPVIRGIAQTYAVVTIRQRGEVLYQSNVAPGAFEIDDLQGTAYAGDLEVEVIENDGRVQHFVVPFASVPDLLRAGQQRVTVAVGSVNDTQLRRSPGFAEATLRRGLSNRTTAFGGFTGTEGYQSIVLGGALNTHVGAFSSDMTISRVSLPDTASRRMHSTQGQSYRVAYSKDFAPTGTNLSVAAYRYSTDGFLTLREASLLRQDLSDGGTGSSIGRQRSRMDINLYQQLGERSGSLYASASTQTFWNLAQRRSSFTLGYSGSIKAASYSVSAQRVMDSEYIGGYSRTGNGVYFNITVPLGRNSAAPQFTAATNRRETGVEEYRTGLTGTFGKEGQGSYGVAASRNSGQGNSTDLGLGYRTSAATLNAGYTHGNNTRGVSVGASGGVVVHGDGIAFAQQLGDTVGLVQVQGTKGAAVGGVSAIRTDARGYAVMPYLTPFRRNEVTVDPKGLPLDVELKAASALTVPTAGAVVKLVVLTERARSALIEARQEDGAPLPFGADVHNEAGNVVGVVGQSSRLWVRGIEAKGILSVGLGNESSQRCEISYDLATADENGMIRSACRLTGGAQ